jgi:hypothetical protein
VHAALHDDVGLHLGGFDRELQRVANDVGDAVEDLRRLVIMRQDDRVAGLLQLVDRFDIGRHERPLDRRDHAFDPFVKMRGGAFDFGGPLQRWHRQGASALGSADAAAQSSGGTPVDGISEIVRAVDTSDRHGGLPWIATYTQIEHIWDLRNPASRGRLSWSCAG